ASMAPASTLFGNFNTSVGFDKNWQPGGSILDVRPTKIVHLRDGGYWTETFTYDTSNIPADSGFRTLGNVTSHTITQGGGPIGTSQKTYLTDAAHQAVNRIRLISSSVVMDGNDVVISRTNSAYDEFALSPSGAPNLDTSIGSIRGNLTTQTAYTDAPNSGGPVTTTHRYYDNGALRSTVDARGFETTI